MVRVLHMGLILVLVSAVSFARPLPRRRQPYDSNLRGGTAEAAPPTERFEDDGSVRSERSTNLSHITGTERKIRMFMLNKYLQVLPDGTVNGTADYGSDYTILQRSSVGPGQLTIRGYASCLFLCMDSCGLVYASKEDTKECIFKEVIEEHNYNAYSSVRYSNAKRTMYLALDSLGRPRKLKVKSNTQLGARSMYTHVLPQTVTAERVDALERRILDAQGHTLRHHGKRHLCPQRQPKRQQEADESGRDVIRCRRRKKRKKKKRRCRENEEEGDLCQKRPKDTNKQPKKKCDEGEDVTECKKRLQAAKHRRKAKDDESKVSDNSEDNLKKNAQKRPKPGKNKKKPSSDGEVAKDIDSNRKKNKSKLSGKGKKQNQRDLAILNGVKVEEGDNVTMTTVSSNSTVSSSATTNTTLATTKSRRDTTQSLIVTTEPTAQPTEMSTLEPTTSEPESTTMETGSTIPETSPSPTTEDATTVSSSPAVVVAAD